MTVVDRFLQYVKFDTQSDELTQHDPLHSGQMIFAQSTRERASRNGPERHFRSIQRLPYGHPSRQHPAQGCSYCGIHSSSRHIPRHERTPRFTPHSGELRRRRDHPQRRKGIVLSPAEFPELKNYIGSRSLLPTATPFWVPTTKAGIAEIITAVAYLKAHPE